MPPSVPRPSRRIVRTSTWFYEDLDRQLGVDRGTDGKPSAHDFLVHELLRVVEVFAMDFDSLPEHLDQLPGCRVLITPGFLVPAFSVVGRLAPDDGVDLIALELDLDWG